ncbi:MAG: hypothetical protein DRQ62_06915 [Gammaproteobacteria bacterium]|nr:MAG: hypothetical protein DRQ62_06915 [Gammaproteobacteria bacterium]
MQEKQRASIQSGGSIVGLGKSKRLAAIAMRQSIELRDNKQIAQPGIPGNKKARQIQEARAAIKAEIARIKATYPQGKQNKLFALRYGTEEKINQMSLQKILTLLNIKLVLAKEIAELEFLDKLD